MKVVAFAGRPGSGKTTTAAALFAALTGGHPHEGRQDVVGGVAVQRCLCGAIMLLGRWDAGLMLRGGDKVGREEAIRPVLGDQTARLLISDSIHHARFLTSAARAFLVHLDPSEPERAKRLVQRGSRSSSHRNDGVWRGHSDLRCSFQFPEEVAFMVRLKARLRDCNCMRAK